MKITRSQAVARIADRTASQHLRGSHDVIGHVILIVHMSFPIGGPIWNGVINPAVFKIGYCALTVMRSRV